uniref:S-adenosyl-L-methionine-dependent methyltransferase n=1 Tax=Panagrolaimus sp. JU765 TaxID=591449 RepID=A0AC34RSC7_9BILA
MDDTLLQGWISYRIFIAKCAKELVTKWSITPFHAADEEKLFVNPINKSTDLKVVTLGIGYDTKAEEEFKKSFPQTKFYGVDLDEVHSGKKYIEKLNGTFLKGLVGAKPGNYTASVMAYNNEAGYQDVQLPHMSFKEVLKEFK